MGTDVDNNFPTPAQTSELAMGRSYGKGRGFMVAKQFDNSSSTVGRPAVNANDDWGNVASSGTDNNTDWGTAKGRSIAPKSNSNNDYDWGTGGNNAESSHDDNWPTSNAHGQTFDNDADDDGVNNNRQGGRYNRTSNDRHGGDRRDRNNDEKERERGRSKNREHEGLDDENNEEKKKPAVVYIPPERSMDDQELFGSGVAAGIYFDKYDDIKVEVSGDNVPPSIDNFKMGKLRASLITNIDKSGYVKPTPVQKYAIPIMMHGRDVMACAQTGSGKTAAYLIPIIHKLLEENDDCHLIDRGCAPQVLIMAPTRELVVQICWEAQKFAKDTVIRSISIYGGVATMHQVRQLERGAHILVATPGRLCDFVDRGRIEFSAIRFVVLDEADRMLDLGFLSGMEKILGHESMVPVEERQTVMFSATLKPEIQNLAARFMKNYLFLCVGHVGGACEDVEQNFYEVEKKSKRRKLSELLNLDGGVSLKKKILVFVETKKTADFIAAYMSDNNFPATSIHGDREQREREIALNDFKSGRMPILVATSVASRGLDIQEVAHVINYDLPKCIDDYVHRIGRTGRIGNKGKATSFYDPDFDSNLAPDLVRILTTAKKEIPEFLKGIGGGFDGGMSSDFGGHDIRGDYTNGGEAAEPEEQW